MTKARSIFVIVCTLFILSGVAALIYQVVWFKQLAYFIGNTTYSQSIVLATYMGGLALGAWYWGKKSDSLKNALYLFAGLEIILALYCFFYAPIFGGVESLFTHSVITFGLESDSGSVLLLKFLVSGLTILFPTFLMGGTLPVLVKFLSHRIDDVGKNVSILYFINSFGAVIGTVLAGFYLIQAYGLTRTTYFAAGVELLVGFISLFLARIKNPELTSDVTSSKNQTEKIEKQVVTAKLFRFVLIVSFLSGFCAMVYEVLWLRLLIPVLSSSTYSFSIILAAFISGITIGSYLTYRFHRKISNPIRFVGLCQFAIVMSILLTLPLYERLPYSIWTTIHSPFNDVPSYGYYLFIQFVFVFFVLVVPTIFMGMTLPVLSRIAVNNLKTSGNTIGNVFAVNTLGTVIGSLITGLVLIPLVGVYFTILLALAINISIAIRIAFIDDAIKKNQRITLLVATVLSLLIFFSKISTENWAYSILLSETSRSINRSNPPSSFSEFFEKIKSGNEILFYKEGVGGTIIVGKNSDQIFLSTNGKGDANSVSDLRTQVSLGQTPVILHPNAESVFIIGYGAGTTIGNVMAHPNVKFGEVAEISAEVVEASNHFNSINEQPLKRKNLKVIRDDGLAALRLSKNKYDVIISQPSNPWSAGVGNLFTKEFFADCKSKLKPGGYVAQWFSFYEMNDKSLQLILRTALSEFKYLSLWHIGTSDILLLCSDEPFQFDLKSIEKNYNLVSNKLENINIRSFSAFLSQQIISSTAGVREYAGVGPLNSEDHPLLELWAPEAYYFNSEPSEFVKLDERNNFEKSDLLLKKHLDRPEGVSKDEILQAGLFQSLGGNKSLAYYLADINPEIYLTWSELASKSGNSKEAMEFLELATKKLKMNPSELHKQKAMILGSKGDYKSALSEINVAITNDPGSAVLHYQKGTFHMSINEFDMAIPALEKAIELDPYMIDAYNNIATIRGKMKDYNGVISILNKAVIISDKNPKVFFNRAYAKGFMNDFSGAVEDFTKCLELEPRNGQALVLRGRAYISMGKKAEACSDFTKAKNLGTQGAQESINQFCR